MEFSSLDLTKTYTYADYYKWDFEERVELINGKVYDMMGAPNQYHQYLSGKIFLKLGNFLERKPCKVFYAPFDVRLPRKSNKDEDIITVLQPDLCVICDKEKLLDIRGCLGAPDIVVEILSPSNSKKELKYKYDVYEEAGVKEYWVVFPTEQTILTYILVENKFMASRPRVSGDVITSAVLPGFSLDVADLFEEV